MDGQVICQERSYATELEELKKTFEKEKKAQRERARNLVVEAMERAKKCNVLFFDADDQTAVALKGAIIFATEDLLDQFHGFLKVRNAKTRNQGFRQIWCGPEAGSLGLY